MEESSEALRTVGSQKERSDVFNPTPSAQNENGAITAPFLFSCRMELVRERIGKTLGFSERSARLIAPL